MPTRVVTAPTCAESPCGDMPCALQTPQLYMTLQTEDGALKANPDISTISLERHVPFEVLASSAVQLNCTDQLKSPNSIADVKVSAGHTWHQEQLQRCVVLLATEYILNDVVNA